MDKLIIPSRNELEDGTHNEVMAKPTGGFIESFRES